MAAYVYYRLKKAGYRAELVGEAAREIIYASNPGSKPGPLVDNQILLAGLQHERVMRLERHRVQIAISDSPVIQNLMYCMYHPYFEDLLETMKKALGGWDTYNVLIRPNPGYFDPESRMQTTEDEARALDAHVRRLMGEFWLEVGWDQEELLAERVLDLLSHLISLPS